MKTLKNPPNLFTTTFKLTMLLFLAASAAMAQDLYEVKWHSDGIDYTGLLVYYHDQDAFMRVAYTDKAGDYIVAEFSCYGDHDHFDGQDYYTLDGSTATVVYPTAHIGSYNADNFIFREDPDDYSANVYTIDDEQLNHNDWLDHLKEVDSWREITADDLTITYVRSFFEPSEYYFDYLIQKHLSNQPISHNLLIKLKG